MFLPSDRPATLQPEDAAHVKFHVPTSKKTIPKRYDNLHRHSGMVLAGVQLFTAYLDFWASPERRPWIAAEKLQQQPGADVAQFLLL